MNLQNEEAKKVEVGSALELLKKVEGEECKQGVFWGLDEVVLKHESGCQELEL